MKPTPKSLHTEARALARHGYFTKEVKFDWALTIMMLKTTVLSV
jgi:hypothetical protein